MLATILGLGSLRVQGSLPGRRHVHRSRWPRSSTSSACRILSGAVLGRLGPPVRPGQALLAVLPRAAHVLLRGPRDPGRGPPGRQPVPRQRGRAFDHGGARQRECRRRLHGCARPGRRSAPSPSPAHWPGMGGALLSGAYANVAFAGPGQPLHRGQLAEPGGHGGHRRHGLGHRRGHRGRLGHRHPRPGPQQRRSSGSSRRASGCWPSCSTSPAG